MIGLGGKMKGYDIRQDQKTLEVTIYRGHQLYYRTTEDRILSFDELQNLLFEKVRTNKNGL